MLLSFVICVLQARFLGIPRPSFGIGFMVKASLDVSREPENIYKTFKSYKLKMKDKESLSTKLVYGPPLACKNELIIGCLYWAGCVFQLAL